MSKFWIGMLLLSLCHISMVKSFGGIQDVYVINLDRRKDRAQSMHDQLKALDVPYIRFSAIDGNELKELAARKKDLSKDELGWPEEIQLDLRNLKQRVEQENDGQWGRFGCWQSHLQVYFAIIARAKETGRDGPVMILEDDVAIQADVPQLVEAAMATLPDDWEFFAPGHMHALCFEEVSDHVCRARRTVGAQGYILRNSSVARKLVEASNIDAFPIADLLWLDMMWSGTLSTFVYIPKSIVQQDPHVFSSDISASLVNPKLSMRRVAADRLRADGSDDKESPHYPLWEVRSFATSTMNGMQSMWITVLAVFLLIF